MQSPDYIIMAFPQIISHIRTEALFHREKNSPSIKYSDTKSRSKEATISGLLKIYL